ncbi:SDR family oxidoreductase [Rhodococcus opacus]|uniref:3-oxoacyl-[acyl-carrier protein] reductase n=1 Tax=Rhodococcus opacus M213 TaxID=1129896 RepID=K8XP81_RHOOP|nr:SDR family oxidoreductase [Rhodococcus opacus]EKT79997.1 3-oxoacyl-[acyl-carrier protein] reductase [Rhodococcus opacus M213]NHU41707.1 SDR family oxidoreductase [Rhodococcus sp. A14]UNN01157.1 SDR family oxidoreductase [Rhodococcus opacus]WKN53264.1 SDR family oxidoreductase [Rhodococcus opacus]
MSSAAAPVALITGATGGIGSAVARRLHREGMRVVVSSSSSITQGQRLADELVPAAYIRADLTDPVQARHLVDETIKHFGQLDLLVNNAAAFAQIPHEDLEAVTPEVWRRLFDVNVIGAWCAIQAAQPALAAANGHIVNITSIAALRPMGASIPYAVSKAALGHMTALVAKALGPQVRANAVAPGLVITERTAEWAAARNEVEERAPLRRAGMPDDIADAVVALQNAPYVTGETIAVDGGLHLL